MKLGSEIRITLQGCSPAILNSRSHILQLVRSICALLKVEIRSEICHEFDPQGISVTAILAESHCAIHTWPEDDLQTATVDIFTCGGVDPVAAVPLTVQALKATSSNFITLKRSLSNNSITCRYPNFPEYILSAPPYGHFPHPTFRRGIGREYLLEPEGLSWERYFTSEDYATPAGKDILLLHPCSWAKPYDFSHYVTRLRNITDKHPRIHRVIISNVGLVPFEYQMNEFFCSYDYIDVRGNQIDEGAEDLRQLYRKLTADRIQDYVLANRENYRAVVLLGHPIAGGCHETVSNVAQACGLIGFQAPSADTYLEAIGETRGDRDIDAPLFATCSLRELERGLFALEDELDNTEAIRHD